MNSNELAAEYFIENRTRLLEIAAFLDRLDRAGNGYRSDYRMKAFTEALTILADKEGGDRLGRIQMLLSDPTVEPKPELDTKGASGAYDRWSQPAAGEARQ